MKKLIAILLTAIMLLSACAFAEGGRITVKNMHFETVDTLIELDGFDVVLEGAAEDDAMGLRVGFVANGADLCDVIAALAGQQLLLKFNGSSNNAYALDLSQLGLELEDILGELEANITVNGGDLSEEAIAQLGAMFEGSISDGGITNMYDEDFNTTLIYISPEQITQLIALLAEQAEDLDADGYTQDVTDELEDVNVSVEGAVYNNENATIVDLTVYVDSDGEQDDVNIYAVYVEGGADDGSNYLSVMATISENGEAVAILAAEFEFAGGTDTSWLQIDSSNAIDVMELIASDEVEAVMTQEFTNLGTMIAAGAMSAIYANMAAQMSE